MKIKYYFQIIPGIKKTGEYANISLLITHTWNTLYHRKIYRLLLNCSKSNKQNYYFQIIPFWVDIACKIWLSLIDLIKCSTVLGPYLNKSYNRFSYKYLA